MPGMGPRARTGRRAHGRVVAGLVVGVLAVGACAGPGARAVPAVPTVLPGGDPAAHGLHVGTGERVSVALDRADGRQGVVAATWRAGFAALAASDDPAVRVSSPASLVTALAMLGEGATGDAVAAFDAALGAPGDARTDAVDALTGALARYEGDPAVVQEADLPTTPVVHVANQVVVDDGQRLAEPFLDRLRRGYGAGVLVTDLSSPAGKRDLDAWVARNSGGLVRQSAVQPDPQLVLVLQNAVTLAAAWQRPFDPSDTSDAPFAVPGRAGVSVPTVHQTGTFALAEVDGWRALRLPYTADLHADVLLPPEGSPQAADPATADPATVAALVAALDAARPDTVSVALARLDATTKTDLLPAVRDIGLGRLLDQDTADLGGLLVDPPGPPYLAQAWQQTVLRVDEAGTRAAAVTELGVAASSAVVARQSFVVDRPYLFVVGDGESGWPLFLAAVRDPRG